MTPEELAAREALGGLPAEHPDSARRARILTGVQRTVRSEPSRARSLALVAAGAIAAGLAALAIFFFSSESGFGARGPTWEVLASSGYGADAPGSFSPGESVQTCADCELTLRAGNSMVWVVTPGSEATFPSRSLFGSRLLGHVARGEVRITTGIGFEGNELEMHTGEALVRVSGTTLAVTCTVEGTCICVFEGDVEVGRLGGDRTEQVPDGKRLRLFKDRTDSGLEDLQDMDRMKLGMLRDQGAAELAPSGATSPGNRHEPK
jgi:hypothetical protein